MYLLCVGSRRLRGWAETGVCESSNRRCGCRGFQMSSSSSGLFPRVPRLTTRLSSFVGPNSLIPGSPDFLLLGPDPVDQPRIEMTHRNSFYEVERFGVEGWTFSTMEFRKEPSVRITVRTTGADYLPPIVTQ